MTSDPARLAKPLSWVPAVIGMTVLFTLSSLPGDKIHLPGFQFSDKVVHFLAYTVLGWLLAARHGLRRRLGGEPQPYPPPFDFTAMAVGVLYGVSDEIHQLFVPLREFGFADMAADALGITTACWAYRRWAARRPAVSVG